MRPLSPKTRELYGRALTRVFGGDSAAVGSFAPYARIPLAAAVAGMPDSQRSILRAALIRAYTEAHLPGAEHAVAAVPRLYTVKKELVFLSDEELAKLEAFGGRRPAIRVFVTLTLKLGLRAEEALMLPREAVMRALSTGQLTFAGKGGKERTLPVSTVAAALKASLDTPRARGRLGAAGHTRSASEPATPWAYLGETLSPSGPRVQYNLLLGAFKTLARGAGVDPARVSVHKFRHGFATRLLVRDAAPLPVVQKALGHSSGQTTMRYAHATVADLEKFIK